MKPYVTLLNSLARGFLFSSEVCESLRLETPALHSWISHVLPVPALGCARYWL